MSQRNRNGNTIRRQSDVNRVGPQFGSYGGVHGDTEQGSNKSSYGWGSFGSGTSVGVLNTNTGPNADTDYHGTQHAGDVKNVWRHTDDYE